MKSTTLCFLLKDNEILLALKKRGFGINKWNGVGGKIEVGESIEEAAVRELKEEIGVDASLMNLNKAGSIKFYFANRADWNNHMHIFLIRDWQGQPEETEEMKPQWHSLGELPFESMWIDDSHWLPLVLSGKKIEAEFYFDSDGQAIERFEIKEI